MKILSFHPSLLVNRKRILAGGLIAFIGGALLCGVLLNLSQLSTFFGPVWNVSGQPFLRFSSYEELVDFVNASYGYPSSVLQGGGPVLFGQSFDAAKAEVAYSTTNIQVAGVDEVDIVKTDGEYLYVVSNQSIFILKAYPPEELSILSEIKLNGTLYGIFVNGDKLVVFGSNFSQTYLLDSVVGGMVKPSYYWPYSTPSTFIKVYDVSDREAPVSTRNVTLDGYYLSSRMIGDYVYTVINDPAYVNGSVVKLPAVYVDGEVREVKPTEIAYCNVNDYGYSFTTILAVNVQNDLEEPTHETILIGTTSNMYVSPDNIYITLFGHPDVETWVAGTLVYRIHVEEGSIKSEASGAVPGSVLNQFSMDEYDGYFRIATETWFNSAPRSNLFILDMDLNVVGKLLDIEVGETLDSARFIGNRCYLSTSVVRKDPFFVVDVTDASKPKILGYLKIPGFTRYIHPYDENHVIGVGRDEFNKVRVSLFDVSDVSAPVNMSEYRFGGDWSDTTALSDHKAFLFDYAKGLLAIPAAVYYSGYDYYTTTTTEQGLFVFNITLTDGLVLRGNITHQDAGVDKWDVGYYVKRGLYIKDVLYTVSDRKIKLNSLSNLKEIGEIELP